MTPVTVLLVDDNLVQMGIRKVLLERTGFEVLTATSADAAFALLRPPDGSSRSPDVIITDHIMPEVSGSAFVRRLRAIDTTTPVIVISGLPYAGDEYPGLNVHFRYKPYHPPELIQLVNSLTQNKALYATA